jgi:hypothetical protein
MDKRTIETAERFGILNKLQQLENDLLKIKGISEVEFDIDGFWDDMDYVILVPKYSIPSGLPVNDYFAARREQLNEISECCLRHNLIPTEDRIEDYGEHWYIVRKCKSAWRT